MLDARNMWMAMAAFTAVFVGYRALSPTASPAVTEPSAIVLNGYGAEMRVARINRAECVGAGDRIWLAHALGNDCTTVLVPPILKAEGSIAETAVVFIDGDVPPDQQNASDDARTKRTYIATIEQLTTKLGVPVIVLARPGVLGSSGTHQYSGRRDDTHVVDAALDELKKRYGIRHLVMAGQSGGARLIAQLLVLGRRDIACAVLGSGAYDTPVVPTNIFGDPGKRFLVPMRHVAEIASVRDRRVFVVGDPRDTVTPFPEQRAWAEALTKANHHAVLVETEARGDKHHGASRQSLEAAGRCAKGEPDAAVIEAARRAPS